MHNDRCWCVLSFKASALGSVAGCLLAPQLECNVDARHTVESHRLRLTTAATHTQKKQKKHSFSHFKILIDFGLSLIHWQPCFFAIGCFEN